MLYANSLFQLKESLNPLKAGQEFGGAGTGGPPRTQARVSIPLKRVKNSELVPEEAVTAMAMGLNPLKAGQEFGGEINGVPISEHVRSQSP